MTLTNIIKLAFSYVKYYKKQTLALLLGTVMSTALMTGVGSLMYSGRTADLQRIRDVYGDAHYRFDMKENLHSGSSSQWRETKAFTVEKCGILTVKKEVKAPYQITLSMPTQVIWKCSAEIS